METVRENEKKAVGHVSLEQLEYKGMLYDFYGELLTPHQKGIYEDAVFNDLSLGEIAGEQGISRQGVHDSVKRSVRALESYEEKLHLVEKFLCIRDKVGKIQDLAGSCDGNNLETMKAEIRKISNEILEEL